MKVAKIHRPEYLGRAEKSTLSSFWDLQHTAQKHETHALEQRSQSTPSTHSGPTSSGDFHLSTLMGEKIA